MTEPLALPLDEADTLRIELNALRAEVIGLRVIADAAAYVTGVASCADWEDRDCEEYVDENGDNNPAVEWCSHVEQRHATYADVHVRQRLEWLVDEIRQIVDDPAADHREQVREAVHNGVYALVVSLQQEIDDSGPDVDDLEPYKSVLEESIGSFLEAAIRSHD